MTTPTPHQPDVPDAPAPEHDPAGLPDAEVETAGKMTEALEMIEQARGMLYGFHRLTGAADLAVGDVVERLRGCGADELADRINAELVGRNVLQGRWTFQLIEEYDDGYYATFRDYEALVREALVDGKRHLAEAAMKEDRRTHGRPDHEAQPPQT